MRAELYEPSAGWQTLAGTSVRKGRGQVKGKKKLLREVLEAMGWPKDENDRKVGLLKHFLGALDLHDASADERAETFKKNLRAAKHPERIEQRPIPGKCGRPPYVASKSVFRALYKFV